METCRASTLLAELEDDDEDLPDPDDDDDDENEDDNDDDDYDDVMVRQLRIDVAISLCIMCVFVYTGRGVCVAWQQSPSHVGRRVRSQATVLRPHSRLRSASRSNERRADARLRHPCARGTCYFLRGSERNQQRPTTATHPQGTWSPRSKHPVAA